MADIVTIKEPLSRELERRNVVLEGESPAQLRLRCRVCGERWEVNREGLEPPSDRNHWWWCPGGCNREE